MGRRVKPGLFLNLESLHTEEPTNTEEKLFNETKTFILNHIATITPPIQNMGPFTRRIVNIISEIDTQIEDPTLGCEKLTSSARNKGRGLSRGCSHAIAHYYNCKTGKGVKTYTFDKHKYRHIIAAPYKEGDITKYQKMHMDNCKYKIAREIVIQLFAHAVSTRCNVIVPAIYRIGCKHNLDSDIVNKDDEGVEIPDQITYYVEMDHIVGRKFTTTNAGEIISVVNKLRCMYNLSYIQHRDVKPDNIYFMEDDKIGIIDWGESTCKAEPFEENLGHTWVNNSPHSTAAKSDNGNMFGGGRKRKTRRTKKNRKRKKTARRK